MWFDLLIYALSENTKNISDQNTIQSANALMEKLLKYSRPYTDEKTGIDCADIRFFPDEASQMIWQLLVVCGFYLDEDVDFYSVLKENHISNPGKEP